MPTNIEIKCRVRDPEHLRTQAERLSDTPVETLQQTDTFFRVESGRLKLRRESADQGVLIFYQRPDAPGPRPSHYQIARSSDPDTLLAILADVLGVLGVVRKTRLLYRTGSTRIHLDEVEGLGPFLELEVVLGPDDSTDDGLCTAESLMHQLGIDRVDLVGRAYFDLLREKGRSAEF